MSLADQIIGVESGGNPNARNPSSSASGLGQFIDSTWLNTIRAHRPDLANRYNTQELLSLKADPDLSRQMTEAYADDNAAYLRGKGLDTSPGSVYLAHFAGPEGAAALLSAGDQTPVANVMSPGAIKANPFLRNMSVGSLRQWASRKMGDSQAPVTTAAADPSYAMPPANAQAGSRMPASIRTHNPGAQWLGPVAKQFGATNAVNLPGGNNAATFSNPVNGAAAQFALWGKRYAGMPLSAAISKWSGGNSSSAYANFIYQRTGLSPNSVITPDVLSGPQGLALAKAQAHWEAGRPYPMSDDQWAQAQKMAFGGSSQTASAGENPALTTTPGSSPQSGSFSQFQTASATPAISSTYPTTPSSPTVQSDQQQSGNVPSPGDVTALMAVLQNNNSMPSPPPLHINYATPPGLARAQMLARAMAESPISNSTI
jgi:hypothetical protein